MSWWKVFAVATFCVTVVRTCLLLTSCMLSCLGGRLCMIPCPVSGVGLVPEEVPLSVWRLEM